jgi:hypothetical protein
MAMCAMCEFQKWRFSPKSPQISPIWPIANHVGSPPAGSTGRAHPSWPAKEAKITVTINQSEVQNDQI